MSESIVLELRKEIKKAIKLFLSEYNVGVYFKTASDKAKMPYIVFGFDTIKLQNESIETFILNIDAWSYENSKVQLDEIMSTLDGNGELEKPTGLNKYILISDKITIVFKRENIIILEERDKKLLRRRYTYTVSVLERR